MRLDVVDPPRTDLLPRLPWPWPRRDRVTSADLPVRLRGWRLRASPSTAALTLHCRRLSLAAALDVAAQLRRCRLAGLRVLAHSDHLDLAAMLAMAPALGRSAPPLAGPIRPTITRTHLHAGTLLDRLGHPMEIVASGSLKSVAQITSAGAVSSAMLENERDVYGTILGAALREIASEVGEGAAALARAPSRGMSALEAVDAGLLTHVGYQADLKPSDLSRTAPGQYSPPRAGRRRVPHRNRQRASVAIVDAWGPLIDLPLARHRLSRRLVAASRDPWVGGIVLRVHSSGGDIDLADRLWTQIRVLANRVPVVAYLLVATSAALHIATAATAVVANPCALLGSVGAVALAVDFDRLLRRLGIERTRVAYSSGGAVEPNVPPSPVEIARERTEIARALMVWRIATGRHLPRLAVAAIADGRLLSAASAVEAGLCDALGTLEDAIARVTDLAGLDDDAPAFVL